MSFQIETVNPNDVFQKLRNGKKLQLLDVRSSTEFNEEHVTGSQSLPLDRVSASQVRKQLGPTAGHEETVFLLCAAGIRAAQAAQKLAAEGLNNLAVVDGGTYGWKEARLPLNIPASDKWKIARSPQAQVEMLLGLLVMVFTVKGMLLHPIFTVLVAFIGIALMLSAMSERYKLAKLFANLPWNKTSVQSGL